MSDMHGIYLSAAAITQARMTRSATLASGNASSNSKDAWTLSIASWRSTRIAGFCKEILTLFLGDMTSSVSGGHVLEILAELALAGTLLCWCDASFLTIPPVCMPIRVESEVCQDGLYRIIIRQGHEK